MKAFLFPFLFPFFLSLFFFSFFLFAATRRNGKENKRKKEEKKVFESEQNLLSWIIVPPLNSNESAGNPLFSLFFPSFSFSLFPFPPFFPKGKKGKTWFFPQ